jgi:hypothetical protein
MFISTWTPELLQVFQWLPLKSLIATKGVNRQWRHLVPLADIHPARHALLNLYIDFLASPAFLSTRPTILAESRQFDREAYIVFFRENDCAVPDEFLLWVLEWPNQAVIGWTWPGLRYSVADLGNSLGARPQRIQMTTFLLYPTGQMDGEEDMQSESGEKIHVIGRMQCLEVVEAGCSWSWWLVLDGPKKDWIGTMHHSEGRICEYESLPPHTTWIEWLRRQVIILEKAAAGEDRCKSFGHWQPAIQQDETVGTDWSTNDWTDSNWPNDERQGQGACASETTGWD